MWKRIELQVQLYVQLSWIECSAKSIGLMTIEEVVEIEEAEETEETDLKT